MVVVSEHAKSAGKTDNTTDTQQNSLCDVHHDEQGKNLVFAYIPLVLKSLVLSIATISGSHVWAGVVCTITGIGSALSTATGTNATACGVGNAASGIDSSAVGSSNTASGDWSSAVGSASGFHIPYSKILLEKLPSLVLK
jgi:hypothetical protein